MAGNTRNRFFSTFALLWLWGWVTFVPGAWANIRFDVFPGFDGTVPTSGWFPVACEVHNDGPTFTAMFEVSSGNFTHGDTWRMPVELPTGTLKRFVIPVHASGPYTYSYDARLLDPRGKVRAESTGLRVRSLSNPRYPIMGALTRSLPTLPEMANRGRDQLPGVSRILTDLFPDNPIALQGMDTLFVSSERALELKENQVVALLTWLEGGGHLIVGVDQTTQVNGTEWLRNLLPISFTDMTSLSQHGSLQEWLISLQGLDGLPIDLSLPQAPRIPRTKATASSSASSSGKASNPYTDLAIDRAFEGQPLQVAVGRMRDGEVLVGPSSTPLIVGAARGRGRVTVLNFNPGLEPFLSWANRSHFWAKAFHVPVELLNNSQNYGYGVNQGLDGLFGVMIDSRQIRKLPVGWLLLLLVAYLIVIGPLDRWWLKKVNRQMLTWLTFPAYVAFFSLLIYFIGYKLRAGETEWNEMHLVDLHGQRNISDWFGRSYGSVYSPANATYALANPQTFASLRSEFGVAEGSRTLIEQVGNVFSAQVSVPVWTSRLLVSDWVRQDQPPVLLTVLESETGWNVTVENRLEKELTSGKVALDNQLHSLGNIAPGQSRSFQLKRGEGDSLPRFVSQYSQSFDEAVRRRQNAFGGNDRRTITDLTNTVAAACFLSQSPNSHLSIPAGMDLTPVMERGNAVFLAWTPDYSPVEGLNQFSPRRRHQDTIWRVSAQISK